MISAEQPIVVVGVDGSPNSVAAMREAVKEAAYRGARLRAVSVPHYPALVGAEYPPYGMDLAVFEAEAEHTLERTLEQACPDPVRRDLIERSAEMGSPAKVLIEQSKAADLVVVGARGRGGFLGLMLGSVSSQVVKHAHCPVLVVPHDRS